MPAAGVKPSAGRRSALRSGRACAMAGSTVCNPRVHGAGHRVAAATRVSAPTFPLRRHATRPHRNATHPRRHATHPAPPCDAFRAAMRRTLRRHATHPAPPCDASRAAMRRTLRRHATHPAPPCDASRAAVRHIPRRHATHPAPPCDTSRAAMRHTPCRSVARWVQTCACMVSQRYASACPRIALDTSSQPTYIFRYKVEDRKTPILAAVGGTGWCWIAHD